VSYLERAREELTEAMKHLSLASNWLKGSDTAPQLPEFYLVNRIWRDVDDLEKRIKAACAPSVSPSTAGRGDE
jgi:hypothetical protein